MDRISNGELALHEHNSSLTYADKYNIYNMLAELYAKEGDTKKGLRFYRKLQKLIPEEDSKLDRADVLSNIGFLLSELGELDSARKVMGESLELFNELAYPYEAAHTSLNLAIVNYKSANYGLATTQSMAALKELKKTDKKVDILSCITTLGLVHLATQNFDQALTCFRNSLRLSKEIPDTLRIGKMLNNLGLTHLRYGNHDSAFVFLRNAARVNKLADNDGSLFHTFVQKAETHWKIGNNDSALYYFHRSKRLQNKILDQNGFAETWDKLAQFHMDNRMADSAKFYAEKAQQVSQRIGAKDVNLHAVQMLLVLELEEKGDRKSLEMFKEFTRLQNIVFNESILREIQNTHAEFQSERKKERIEDYKKQVALSEELNKEQKQRTLFASIASILLLLLAIAVTAYQLNKRRAKDRLLAEREKAHKAEVHSVKKEQELNTFKAKVQAQEKERTRISRELHDGITPAIAAVQLKASKANNDHSVWESLSKITHDLRSLSHQLAPVALDFQSLEESIAHFLSNFDGADGLIIHLKLPDEGLPSFSQEIQISIYRTVQELMTNILKHAMASEARFEFEIEQGYCSLQVVDNGLGFAPDEHHDGIGFTNLKQRVAELGGRLTISPNQGIGTQVYVEIPLPN